MEAVGNPKKAANSAVLCFGTYEADPASGELRKRGIRLPLRDQSFQVLVLLLHRRGELVSREEFRRLLWGDRVFVDFDNNLNAIVGHLREVLCDSAEHPRFIETLPKRGYRFVAEVHEGITAGSGRRGRLLVLPFVNSSGDPAQEYFTEAFTDEIITELANIAPDRLAVIASTTARHYKSTRKSVAAIARELDLDFVVEGAVRRNGDRAVVNVQLVRTADETHVFARKCEADLHDLFTLEASLAREMAGRVAAFDAASVPSPTARRIDVGAYTEYIKGRYEMLQVTPEAMERAKRHFESALARDPVFGLACDGLANLYGYLGFWGFMPPEEAEPLRWRYALHAFQLDPTLAEPRTHVAYRPQKTPDGYTYNWTEAEQEMETARDSAPNSPIIRVRHSAVLLTIGRMQEAVAELERALEFDPLSFEVHFWLCETLYLGRWYERGLREAYKLLELDPSHHLAYVVLGWMNLGMRRYDESIAALRRAVEFSREFPFDLGWLGLALGLGGRAAEARNVLARLREMSETRFVLPSSFAWVHLGLGEDDQAFTWMERAIQKNDEWIHPLKTYPFLDAWRADPRYRVFLRRLNLDGC